MACARTSSLSKTDGSGSTQGTWLFDGASGLVIRQIFTSSPHSDYVYDGRSHWIVSELTGTCSTGNGIVRTNIDNTSNRTCVLDVTNPSPAQRGVHISATRSNGTNPGWVSISIHHTHSTESSSTAARPSNLPTNWASLWLRYYNEIITCSNHRSLLSYCAHLQPLEQYVRNALVRKHQPQRYVCPLA